MSSRGSLSVLGAALVLLMAQSISTESNSMAPPEISNFNGSVYAACKMKPSTSLGDGLPKVYGQVLFKQDYPHGVLRVLLRLKGFPRTGVPQARAVHIHQYGDLHQGCVSTGGHYNPHAVDHPKHPGDFGNFEPQQGKIHTVFHSDATLFGGLSVIGRAVVVHAGVDDLGMGGDAGSLMHGNAGQRLGCCVIGISSNKLWNMYHH